MIKAILFDLDGTIADTIDAIRHGINLAMNELGYPESSREEVLSHINFGARHLIRLSLPEQYQSDEARVDEALAVYDRTYAETGFSARCVDPQNIGRKTHGRTF